MSSNPRCLTLGVRQYLVLAFLFVDGLGLSTDLRSPLQTLDLPILRYLTQNFSNQAFNQTGLAYRVLDTTLGTAGLPQSGTGQTALLTGANAAALLGHHQGPHPLSRLQTLLREKSLQVWAANKGLNVLHANGYRLEYLERVLGSRRNMLSAFAYAAQSAGLELLPLEHPGAIAPAFWSQPEQAGEQLAKAAQHHHLVVLENWSLDYSAHRVQEHLNDRFLELDRFIAGFVGAGSNTTLVLTSDHGNAEEPWHTQHTTNPVPLILYGPKVKGIPAMSSLTDLAPWMKSVLS